MRSDSKEPSRSLVSMRPSPWRSSHSLPSGLTMTSITASSASASAIAGPIAVRSMVL